MRVYGLGLVSFGDGKAAGAAAAVVGVVAGLRDFSFGLGVKFLGESSGLNGEGRLETLSLGDIDLLRRLPERGRGGLSRWLRLPGF